jgi:hypothetical protein
MPSNVISREMTELDYLMYLLEIRMKKLLVVFCVALGLTALPAKAWDFVVEGVLATLADGKNIGGILPGYTTPGLYFKVNVPLGTCPAGTWLTFVGPDSSVRAHYGLLLLSIANKTKLVLYGWNNGCLVTNIQGSDAP